MLTRLLLSLLLMFLLPLSQVRVLRDPLGVVMHTWFVV